MRALCGTGVVATLIGLAGCNDAPPSWQKLLAAKIVEQYPAYQATPTPDGGLLVQRPGFRTVPVDVNAIARFCQRGPKDCDYATDQMLLELREK
jgi:hypothetical protein